MGTKYLIVIITMMFPFTNIFSQRLTYRNCEIDTIIIKSTVGISHSISGKYKSCTDQLCISYDYQKNNYEINSYTKIKLLRKGREIEKTKKYKTASISKEKIQFLIFSLDTGYTEITPNKIGVYKTNIDSLIDKVSFSTRSLLSQKELDKSKNLNILNVFLLKKFNKETLNSYSINTGFYDLFNIKIITLRGNYIVTGRDKNLLRQPWNIYLPVDDNTHISSIQFINIFNLDINKALLQILPKDFMNINSLKIDELIREYLMWYVNDYDDKSNVSN